LQTVLHVHQLSMQQSILHPPSAHTPSFTGGGWRQSLNYLVRLGLQVPSLPRKHYALCYWNW